MSATMNTCERCGAEYLYDPKFHRCADEWETMVPPLPPVSLTTWVEECMAKQYR